MDNHELREVDSSTKHSRAERILPLLACSDVRRQLAKALRYNKKMTLSELSEQVGASSPTAVHALRELAKEHIIHQDEKRSYSLTNIGEILVRKCDEVEKTIDALVQHKEFWLEHDLNELPTTSLDNIGALVDSAVLTSTPTDLFKVFSTFFVLLENAKEIRGVSPIFMADLTNKFVTLVAKDISVELVVTPGVLEEIIRTTDQTEVKKALKNNLTLYKIERSPVAFTVTDYFLQLGFFRHDGTYDWSNDLLSYSTEALEWGKELFAYYVEQAESVVL